MASHRYWRIYVTAVDGSTGYASFSEIELRSVVGGPDITTGLGAACSQSGNGSVGAASAAVDDDQWSESGSSLPLPWWWAIDLGTPQEVVSLSVRAQRVVPNRSPSAFELQGSNDGTTWTTVSSYSGITGWSALEQRLFDVGAQYEVRGQIRVSGVLLTSPRRVRVYSRQSGALVGEADSVAGTFAVGTGNVSGEYYIIPIDLDPDATDWAPPCANRVVSTLVE